MQQTVDGDTTTYTLDLAVGLTQALSDGVPQGDDNNTYLYGVGRVGEYAFANWAYHQHDALGSVRQLTDGDGAVTLTKSFMPYGDELSSNGVGTSSYGFTGEWTDSTGLVYLRARYYAPGQGRFLTQDVWDGNPNQPMSYNSWLYVEDNPVNLADPSGKRPRDPGIKVAKPDITSWLQSEMLQHYVYGLDRRNDVRQMKLLTNFYWATKPFSCGLYPTLYDVATLSPSPIYDVATMSPFNVIVDEFTMFGGISIGHFPATTEAQWFPLGLLGGSVGKLLDEVNTINYLAGIEYGLYGLAIDFATINYSPQPNVINDADNPGSKKVVTICGKAHDASDIGNIMFGLGGQARGYPLSLVYPSAAGFNGLSGEGIISALGPDGRGAAVGWHIGSSGAFTSEASMCSMLDTLDFIGYRDNADQLASWLPSDKVGKGDPANEISSLVRLSGTNQFHSPSTIPELIDKLSIFNPIFP